MAKWSEIGRHKLETDTTVPLLLTESMLLEFTLDNCCALQINI